MTAVSENNSSLYQSHNDQKCIIVAGATGNLGSQIVDNLLQLGATVRVFIRKGSSNKKHHAQFASVVEVVEVDYNDHDALTKACEGGTCVVSALSGLREVIIDAQSNLLHAAVKARVPRFIPSDFCIDYTKLKSGDNRNLDLRREFSLILSRAPISATSVLNGMFMDLLKDQAPVILFGMKRIFFWGNADQPMDFTTIANTASYTAAAALDPSTPRWLRIAGEVATMHELRDIASSVTGEKFHMLRPGGLGAFKLLIKVTKTFSPGSNEVFPTWQGMQYLYDMLTGLPKLNPLDNDRYHNIRWMPVADVISSQTKK